MRTINGQLLYGIEYPAGSGVMHYDFTMRLVTMADSINAVESYPDAVTAKITAVAFCYAITSLGNIPAEALTYELLSTMGDPDYDIIYAKQVDLRKKLKRPNGSLPSTDAPQSSLANTASDTKDS